MVATSHSISFFVSGEPIPQGSSKGFPVKRANGAMGVAITHANPKTMDWRRRIADEAQRRNDEVFEGDRFFRPKNKNHLGDGVRVVCTFYMHRPKNAKAGSYPSVYPDVDKLARAVLDALTDVLWDDDSQVIVLMVRKQYQKEGEGPGVNVLVENI
jgi:crossover junction endodeoxyribonuclease RusA